MDCQNINPEELPKSRRMQEIYPKILPAKGRVKQNELISSLRGSSEEKIKSNTLSGSRVPSKSHKIKSPQNKKISGRGMIKEPGLERVSFGKKRRLLLFRKGKWTTPMKERPGLLCGSSKRACQTESGCVPITGA